jgi:hypothetical protein
MTSYPTWEQEDVYWRENFPSRAYAAGHTYEDYRGAYRYGYESGTHSLGRKWSDVEEDLRTGWDKFEGKRAGGAAWENVKDAVKEAWARITGHHDVDTDKMAEFERERLSGGTYPESRQSRR